MGIVQAGPGLFQIVLDQEALPGFRDFISAWVWKGEKTLLVDPGPTATAGELAKALATLNVTRLDFVLLTHIHIDHSGGTGRFLESFGRVPVVCHEKAVPHLADPERLWAGSLKTLGKTAEAYGEIGPVPADLLIPANGFREDGITPIPTPGHAPHHISYLVGDILFAGETGGVRLPLGHGSRFLRPATPPRFFFETQMKSLETLLATPHRIYCYGHFGTARNSDVLLSAHRDQLLLWRDVIGKMLADDLEDETLVDACLEQLLKKDPELAPWDSLPETVRQRETGFLKNSVRGFLSFLRSGETAATAKK